MLMYAKQAKYGQIFLSALALSACGALEKAPTSPPVSPPAQAQPITVTVFNALDVDIVVGTTTAMNTTVPANSTLGVPVTLPSGTAQVRWASKGQVFPSGERIPDDLEGATVPIAPSITVTAEVASDRYFSPRFTQMFAIDTISYKVISASGERCIGWQMGSGLRWGYYRLQPSTYIQLFAGPNCSPARAGGSWTSAQTQNANRTTGLIALNSGSAYSVSFTMVPVALTLALGSMGNLAVLQRDALGRDVGNYYALTWQSRDPSIASVSSTGAVTGLGLGATAVTASTSGGGISALAQVTVRQPVPTRVEVCNESFFAFCSNSTFLSPGNSVALRANAFDSTTDISDRCTFSWRSSDPAKVALTQNPGTRSVIATRIAFGSVTVFATCQGVTGIFNFT
jgi:hypothetical protein